MTTIKKEIHIIGVPTDYGANRRGVDMGPSAVRYAGLLDRIEQLDYDVKDEGDLSVEQALYPEKRTGTVKCTEEVRNMSNRLSDLVAETLRTNSCIPLVLGGDHSLSIGTITGSAREANTGVLWFDAHADFNTRSTTESGNLHGMALAGALGLDEFQDEQWPESPPNPEQVVLIGIRSLDPGERQRLKKSPVTVFTMSDLDRRGVYEVVQHALEIVRKSSDQIHVSLDMDWLDPDVAPGVGTPVNGGVTYREVQNAMEIIAECNEEDDLLRSIDLVEINPILDRKNQTAQRAVDSLESLLGKRIL